jgi:hypothetical protein
MRSPIYLLLLGALVCPGKVEALECGTSAFFPSSWQRAANSGDVPPERQSRDKEARATLELLERTPIVFRGRVASARYLSDLRKTNTPTSLIAFDHVVVLKGRLAATSRDRKAFIIREQWCDYRCNHGAASAQWPPGETFLVGAHPNEFADPSKAMDFERKRVIYKGRIDAVLGMCDGGRLKPLALEVLNASDDEIVRLKHDYEPRRFN